MEAEDFAAQVSGIAALAEPIRRDLYLYVCSEQEPVSRDQAAASTGVARHIAKFHLDKLVEEGLLDTDFKRLSGRQGPGAGRPSKLYKRSAREVSVTLPPRRYELAAQLMAQAIDHSMRGRTAAQVAVKSAASDLGAKLGQQAWEAAGARPSRRRLTLAACATLADHGYEPRRDGDTITLANCPFDSLARDHTDLVCGMNLALLDAIVARVGGGALEARLDPAPGRCCVVLDSS